MNLTAEQTQIASLIDARVRELVADGRDDVAVFAEMAEYMPGFKRLMDTSTRGEMHALCDRFAGFYRYATILERIAAGIQSFGARKELTTSAREKLTTEIDHQGGV